MAKKRLRPVVIVGYALLLHEADARAQGEAVTRSVRLGLPVPFMDAAIGDQSILLITITLIAIHLLYS